MPRYYFNLYDDEVTTDLEGILLPDANDAISFAYRAAREIAAEDVRSGRLTVSHRIEILDTERHLVDSVTIADAVRVESEA